MEGHLRGRFGRPYLYLTRTETTQRLLDTAQPEGAVAVTEEQTAGRGRLGRSWDAPAGTSILLSILLRPPAGRRAAELSLVAGVAAALAVERASGERAEVKWPNDVLLGGHKVAGMLAETRDGAVLLGIGVNVNQGRDALPVRIGIPAGSLRTVTGRAHDRAPLLADLLLELERRYDAWRERGLDAVHDELSARDFLRGRRVLVDGEEATARGIGRDGLLELETPGGRRRIESGEIELVS